MNRKGWLTVLIVIFLICIGFYVRKIIHLVPFLTKINAVVMYTKEMGKMAGLQNKI